MWRCLSAGYHSQKTAPPLVARPHYPQQLHHLSGAALAPAPVSPVARLSPAEASSPRPPRPPRPALANQQHPAQHQHGGETAAATTPPPRHGPGSYGYTTTNSFVNVHFGPELGGTTGRPLRFPTHNKLQQFPRVSHPPHNFPAPSPAPAPARSPGQHKWSQISKYHVQRNQKPIVRPSHPSVMSPDSHIKQTTARPAAVLPTLTPIISRPSISQLGHPRPAATLANTPSIRFAQSAYSPGSVRTVTLPPFVRTLGGDPLFVR